MYSLVTIISVVLIRKENYMEWLRNIEHTFTFTLNYLWDGVCDGDTTSTKLTNANKLHNYEVKDNLAYVLIGA